MRKDKRNKLIISISVIVVLITSGLLLYFYWPAISGTVNKTGYITAERGQELYNQGVEDGNKNKKELEDKILYYQNLVDQCNTKISESTKTIKSLNQQIEDLNTSNNNKDATIAEKEEIISRNNETIKELRSQITKLENSIEEYKALVNSLKASYEVTATFIFDNQVHKVKVVKRGESLLQTQHKDTELTILQIVKSSQHNTSQITKCQHQLTSLHSLATTSWAGVWTA